MNPMNRLLRWLCCWLVGLLGCGPGLAEPLQLAPQPLAAGSEPAPNFIVTVDDSARMAPALADLQAALRRQFSPNSLPDHHVRLAWQSMNRCPGLPHPGTACAGHNGMARLDHRHRGRFLAWVDGLTASGGTPAHPVLDQAGRYLSQPLSGPASPWASRPGEKGAPWLGCRRSFHLLLSAGAWNSAATAPSRHRDGAGPDGQRSARGGNADGRDRVLPDGVPYRIQDPATRLYRDAWGSDELGSLADLAFDGWARDLQPGLKNELRPLPDSPSPDPLLGPYWNPRNNPATWQHLVQHTIGVAGAAQWHGAPLWRGDSFSGLAPLVRGEVDWPSPLCNASLSGAGPLPCDGAAGYNLRANERHAELWHAALNSRGRFLPAPDAPALDAALQRVLDDIVVRLPEPRTGLTASTGRLRDGGFVYAVHSDVARGTGQVSAFRIRGDDLSVAEQPEWRAGDRLDAGSFQAAQRVVLSHDGQTGVPFEWDRLAPDQQALLRQGGDEALARLRLDYLRGDPRQEAPEGAGFRPRASRLGPIMSGGLWLSPPPRRPAVERAGHARFRQQHVARPPLLFVGASDGLLHGFDTQAQGAEVLAYLPRGVLGRLAASTHARRPPAYLVDGHPFTGDADLQHPQTRQPDWRTLLVSGLGAGGRGYVVLDVTDPRRIGPQQVLLDHSVAPGASGTTEGDDDLGHIFGPPALDIASASHSDNIVQLNNGRWALVLGNGVNSSNERPVLLVQYLDGDKALQRIVAEPSKGRGNGLSAPRLVDIDGDGRMDIAYAGDLLGQLWKFELFGSDQRRWQVSGGAPWFTARDGAGQRQPITSAPFWMAHPDGGLQILFGTGRQLTEADPMDAQVQSLYAVRDTSRYARGATGELTLTAPSPQAQAVGRQALQARRFGSAGERSAAPGATARGWYLDLPVAHERVLDAPRLLEGQKVMVTSLTPARASADGEESCHPEPQAEQRWLNVFNLFTGLPPAAPVFAGTDGQRLALGAHAQGIVLRGTRRQALLRTGADCAPGQPCFQAPISLNLADVPGATADWRDIR
jgi:type IV pilus assembly protein PilY1